MKERDLFIMDKRTILVTGANSGIGFQTALALAQQGHQVILHGRNEQKVQEAAAKIRAETGNENIESIIADLSLMSEIKKMADEIKKNYDHLDTLINNAGSQMGKNRVETAEGHEKTMVINTFAPLLLSQLLSDLLAKSSDGRIVTVSSASYNQGTSDKFLDDIELKDNYEPGRAYGLSKLYVLWLMWHLNSEFQQKDLNITVNCMEPGSALTSLGSEAAADRSAFMKILMVLWRPMMRDPAIPGKTNAYLATSADLKGLTGKFFDSKGRIEKENKKYHSQENEQIVWDYVTNEINQYLS